MGAKQKSRAGRRSNPRLPRWMRDEDMLRRILLCAKAGYPLKHLFAVCGISNAAYQRVREAAKGSKYAGEHHLAKGFIERFDGLRQEAGYANGKGLYVPLVTEPEGKLLAKSIATWKLVGEPPFPDREEGKT